jgi:hypothetical protein
MSAENNPAFPIAWHPEMAWDYSRAEMGLSKRELIAAMAMQGLISTMKEGDRFFPNLRQTGQLVVEASVKYADALLEELAKCD